MKRVIKFRAWDGQSMCPVAQIEWDSDLDVNQALCAYQVDVEGLADVDLKWVVEDEGLVLMQFTGLKDKNGVEIFEGDVVQKGHWRYGLDEHNRIFGPVRFSNGRYILDPRIEGRRKEHGDGTGWGMAFEIDEELWSEPRLLEVIGNIYENPELLQTEVSANA